MFPNGTMANPFSDTITKFTGGGIPNLASLGLKVAGVIIFFIILCIATEKLRTVKLFHSNLENILTHSGIVVKIARGNLLRGRSSRIICNYLRFTRKRG